MKKNLAGKLYLAFQITAAVLTIFLLSQIGPPLLGFVKAVVARSSHCSIGQSLKGLSAITDLREWEEEVASQTKLIKREMEFSLWESPAGELWMPNGSHNLIADLLAEQRQRLYGDPPCAPGDVVIDCGAHVGVFTREALAAGARLVVAVEPSPVNIECLRRNLAAEISAGKVIVYEKGVWDRDDVLFLEHNPANSGADRVVTKQSSGEVLTVPLTTIDKMVSELGLTDVGMIKMDIEGAERKALAGAAGTLERFKPKLAISTYHLEDDPEVIPDVISSAGTSYEISCTFCSRFIRGDRVVPQVLLFR